jgi:hypothetical protein
MRAPWYYMSIRLGLFITERASSKAAIRLGLFITERASSKAAPH